MPGENRAIHPSFESWSSRWRDSINTRQATSVEIMPASAFGADAA
jgi:hypothetical protein